jgi:hypothetical protein
LANKSKNRQKMVKKALLWHIPRFLRFHVEKLEIRPSGKRRFPRLQTPENAGFPEFPKNPDFQIPRSGKPAENPADLRAGSAEFPSFAKSAKKCEKTRFFAQTRNLGTPEFCTQNNAPAAGIFRKWKKRKWDRVLSDQNPKKGLKAGRRKKKL